MGIQVYERNERNEIHVTCPCMLLGVLSNFLSTTYLYFLRMCVGVNIRLFSCVCAKYFVFMDGSKTSEKIKCFTVIVLLRKLLVSN